jgi:hypothetical protein
MKTNNLIIKLVNFFELSAVIIVLFWAFAFQLLFHELPCPLCVLQRVGLIGIAFGFLLNFRFGFRPSHYAIVLTSGLFTSFVALRQIVLHVIPNTGSYGPPLFGFHLYTWVYIITMTIITITTFLLSVDRQYQHTNDTHHGCPKITNLLFLLVTLLVVANIVSSIFECGLHAECPDNPTQYLLLQET